MVNNPLLRPFMGVPAPCPGWPAMTFTSKELCVSCTWMRVVLDICVVTGDISLDTGAGRGIQFSKSAVNSWKKLRYQVSLTPQPSQVPPGLRITTFLLGGSFATVTRRGVDPKDNFPIRITMGLAMWHKITVRKSEQPPSWQAQPRWKKTSTQWT